MNARTQSSPELPILDDPDVRHIANIANGDRDSFQAIHERYANLLFSVVFKILNDRQDAEEVLQEVFFDLWRKAKLFQSSKGRPATWLTSMARNRAIDRLRVKERQSRLREACAAESQNAPVATAEPSIDGFTCAERRDQCRSVRQAVIRLTPEQQESIELAYFHGLTQKEIAERLHQPVGTVKARIRRGIHRLRETMGAKE